MNDTKIEWLRDYIYRTYKNKLSAIALVVFGILSIDIFKDITFFVFMLIISIPLFFISEDVIEL